MATVEMRTSSTGNTKWRARIRRVGRATQTRTFDTEAEAQAWANTVERQIERGEGTRSEIADTETVRSAVGLYQSQHPESAVTEATAELLQEPFADDPVSALTVDDLRLWATVNTGREAALEALADVIDTARNDWGFALPRNVARAVLTPPSSPRERRLSVFEEKRLLNAANETRGGYMSVAIILAIDTGMSQKDLVNLKWTAVLINARRIQPEGQKGRIIPLSFRAIGVLQTHYKDNTGPVIPVEANTLKRTFSRTVERAEIVNLTFQDLRFEALCRLFEEGYSFEKVKAITGYSTETTLKRAQQATGLL